MPSPRSVVALCLTLALPVVVGCKKDDPPPPAEDQSPQAVRQRQCEEFATAMAENSALASNLVLAKLVDDPQSPSAQADRKALTDAAQQFRQELLDQCLTWPDSLMECVGSRGALREGCEQRVLAAIDGATLVPRDLPAGPEPAWTFTFESEPRELGVADDGTVIAIAGVESDALVALRGGKVVWRREGDHARWLLRGPGAPPTWVVAEENRLVGLDPSTGDARWTASLPPRSKDDQEQSPAVRAAAVHGESLVVVDAEARFFQVSPSRCISAPSSSECVAASGWIADETLDNDARLWVDATGRRYLQEDRQVRVFSSDGQRQVTLGAHDSLGSIVVAGLLSGRGGDRGVALLIDEDVVVLDPAKCQSGAIVAPSGWPQPGVMAIGDSRCEGCVEPPEGCRRWRAHVPDSTHAPAVWLADGTIVVHGQAYTHGVHEGTTRWKTALGGGPLVTDGQRVFGLSLGTEDGRPPGLYALDPATGLPRWYRPIPRDSDAALDGDEVRLAQGGTWLAASIDQTLLVLEPPAGGS